MENERIQIAIDGSKIAKQEIVHNLNHLKQL